MADQADETIQTDRDSGEETFRHPLAVTSDEDGPEGFVRVCIVFPGLKRKLIKNAPANGNLDLKFLPRGMNLTLTMTKDKKKLEKYQYMVKKFPQEIIPEKSYFKVKKDQVVVFLKKLESQSWAVYLAATGLETQVYEEEELALEETKE